MEQIIEAFGIDGRLIIIQIVNFGILMAALTYLLYKPVMKILTERSEKIAQGMTDAEAAGKTLSEASEEKKKIITTANNEAEAVALRAKEYAKTKADEIISLAESKAEQVAKDAVLRSEELKAKALKESEAEIAKLAILAAEKVLKERTS